jgi:hypothetical protein
MQHPRVKITLVLTISILDQIVMSYSLPQKNEQNDLEVLFWVYVWGGAGIKPQL